MTRTLRACSVAPRRGVAVMDAGGYDPRVMPAHRRARTDAALRPLWQCPRCGHRFVTANMWHSCGVVPVDAHFRGKPAAVRRLFDAWRKYVEQFGEFTVLPQKTRISFQTRVRFAGAVIRRAYVQCGFWLTRRVKPLPELFEPVEFIPPRYHVYRFRLTDVRQLRTRGLRAMVRESYDLGWQRRPRGWRLRNE